MDGRLVAQCQATRLLYFWGPASDLFSLAGERLGVSLDVQTECTRKKKHLNVIYSISAEVIKPVSGKARLCAALLSLPLVWASPLFRLRGILSWKNSLASQRDSVASKILERSITVLVQRSLDLFNDR